MKKACLVLSIFHDLVASRGQCCVSSRASHQRLPIQNVVVVLLCSIEVLTLNVGWCNWSLAHESFWGIINGALQVGQSNVSPLCQRRSMTSHSDCRHVSLTDCVHLTWLEKTLVCHILLNFSAGNTGRRFRAIGSLIRTLGDVWRSFDSRVYSTGKHNVWVCDSNASICGIVFSFDSIGNNIRRLEMVSYSRVSPSISQTPLYSSDVHTGQRRIKLVVIPR